MTDIKFDDVLAEYRAKIMGDDNNTYVHKISWLDVYTQGVCFAVLESEIEGDANHSMTTDIEGYRRKFTSSSVMRATQQAEFVLRCRQLNRKDDGASFDAIGPDGLLQADI